MLCSRSTDSFHPSVEKPTSPSSESSSSVLQSLSYIEHRVAKLVLDLNLLVRDTHPHRMIVVDTARHTLAKIKTTGRSRQYCIVSYIVTQKWFLIPINLHSTPIAIRWLFIVVRRNPLPGNTCFNAPIPNNLPFVCLFVCVRLFVCLFVCGLFACVRACMCAFGFRRLFFS